MTIQALCLIYHISTLCNLLWHILKESRRMCTHFWQQHKAPDLLLHQFIPQQSSSCFILQYLLGESGFCPMLNPTLMLWLSGGLMRQMAQQFFTSFENTCPHTTKLGQDANKANAYLLQVRRSNSQTLAESNQSIISQQFWVLLQDKIQVFKMT